MLSIYFTVFIFGGALFGFNLGHLQNLDFDGRYCPPLPPAGSSATTTTSTGAPSQCYWMTFRRYRVGMLIHLATVLPAGLLAVFQFVPVIRHKFILYHRIAGYILILLITVGNAGAVMIADKAMEGDVPTQTFTGFMAILITTTFGLAIYNIKRLQIDQHRAWMLRTWFYITFIITLRLIQIVIATIISVWGAATRYAPMTCDQLSFIYRNDTALYSQYPGCAPGNLQFTTDGYVAVKANLGSDKGQSMAAFGVSFSAAGMLAIVFHAVGVEIYLKLTPREAERLRQVSYERQMERGFRNPGNAGLVIEKFGDADPWVPQRKKQSEITAVVNEVMSATTSDSVAES